MSSNEPTHDEPTHDEPIDDGQDRDRDRELERDENESTGGASGGIDVYIPLTMNLNTLRNAAINQATSTGYIKKGTALGITDFFSGKLLMITVGMMILFIILFIIGMVILDAGLKIGVIQDHRFIMYTLAIVGGAALAINRIYHRYSQK